MRAIGEVAQLLGLAPSTLRWWEKRGLISPGERRAGRRCYSWPEVRRLAMIQQLQKTGLMSLDDISVVLAGRDSSLRWQDVVRARPAAFDEQIDRLTAARRYLEHVCQCHRDDPRSRLSVFRVEVDQRLSGGQTSRTLELRVQRVVAGRG